MHFVKCCSYHLIYSFHHSNTGYIQILKYFTPCLSFWTSIPSIEIWIIVLSLVLDICDFFWWKREILRTWFIHEYKQGKTNEFSGHPTPICYICPIWISSFKVWKIYKNSNPTELHILLKTVRSKWKKGFRFWIYFKQKSKMSQNTNENT